MAILLFLILIIIHEFGHFISAKLLGVRVNEFAVGFGPKIFSKQGKETKYSFNLIPLGGYCAMEGEDETSADDRAFCNKAAWRRFLIVVMGAVFNLLLGLIIVAIILAPSEAFYTTTVGSFEENAVSVNSGLQIDDTIIAVDGRRIIAINDLSYAFTNVKDSKIDITVKRDGKKVELKDVEFASEKVQGMDVLTIDFAVYGQKKTVGSYITNTVKTAASYSVVIWRSLVDLLSGKYGISQVSGPVGVTVALADMAKQNLASLLPMMAFISINLGIFNLLPIPALDGGRLMFILYEMIFRKPVPQKFESLVHTVGFVLLFGFMLLIVAKDILGLIF
ncbi:MAG: site-2 protease family protein [Clostridia bacterium]|nr:site-2 protease family protein [Clostridia bacterium]MBR6741128.1 site-2 protease family protein [Clostridia bacterium]